MKQVRSWVPRGFQTTFHLQPSFQPAYLEFLFFEMLVTGLRSGFDNSTAETCLRPLNWVTIHHVPPCSDLAGLFQSSFTTHLPGHPSPGRALHLTALFSLPSWHTLAEGALRESQALPNPTPATAHPAPSLGGLWPRDPHLFSFSPASLGQPSLSSHLFRTQSPRLPVCWAQYYALWLTSGPCGASRMVERQTQHKSSRQSLGLDSPLPLIAALNSPL